MDPTALASSQRPTIETVRAAAHLLLDPNPKVHRVCESSLLAWGQTARSELEALCECDDPEARARVRGLLRRINVQTWLGEFESFVARDPIALEAGLLLLCRLPRPLLDTRALVLELDEWVEQLRPRVVSLGPRKLVAQLAEFFHRDLGFAGDRRNYYDPANTFIDQVVRRRKGIPISLCSLYLLIGRRLGLPLEGVGLPGHFILRVRGARSVLFDPFHNGRILTRRDCIDRLQAMGYAFSASLLDPVSDGRMLMRYFGNLLHTFGFGEDDLMVSAVQRARRLLAAR